MTTTQQFSEALAQAALKWPTVIRHTAPNYQGYQPAIDYGNHESRCCYRAQDGKKCAVECLIPDELYVPSLEGHTAREVHERLSSHPEYPLLHVSVALLLFMQKAHDTHLPVADRFEGSMKNIAREFNLEYKAP